MKSGRHPAANTISQGCLIHTISTLNFQGLLTESISALINYKPVTSRDRITPTLDLVVTLPAKRKGQPTPMVVERRIFELEQEGVSIHLLTND